jgi:hypothetical protein
VLKVGTIVPVSVSASWPLFCAPRIILKVTQTGRYQQNIFNGSLVFFKEHSCDPCHCAAPTGCQIEEMGSDRTKQTPMCPSCGNSIRLVRAEAAFGLNSGLVVYDCRQCGVALSQAEWKPQGLSC